MKLLQTLAAFDAALDWPFDDDEMLDHPAEGADGVDAPAPELAAP
ncbi:MAG TPA: hypothetical protein VK007_12365 [Acidimicrobiales bacterium]|nr:hypothetical protein [Acidimicrobiales bacterium]